jgi:transposase
MRAYPVELRERVVEAVDERHGTVAEIAQIFGVTARYIYKLLKQRHERGDLAPLSHGGGARPKLSEEQKQRVVTLVTKVPDATLAALREEIEKKLRVEVSMGTLWNLLDSLRLTRTVRYYTDLSGSRSNHQGTCARQTHSCGWNRPAF